MHGTPRSVVAQFRDRLYGFAAVPPKYHACRRPQSTTLRCWPLLAVVKRIPERLHMMRLQDRERLRQCARVVRPRALRRRRRPAGPAFSNATSSARRSRQLRHGARGHGGRRRRSLEGGASVLFLHSEAPVPMRCYVCVFWLCMLCNSRFSACVAYTCMRLSYMVLTLVSPHSPQMTPGHAFDFVSQILTLVHVYDSGHARMTQGGYRLSSNMLT